MPRTILALVATVAILVPLALVTAGDDAPGEATLPIEGMTCGSCAYSIQAALTKLDGVKEARVSFEPAEARVTFDPELVDMTRLVATVEKLGYRVTGQSAKNDDTSGESASCASPPAANTEKATNPLNDEEFDRVVAYLTATLIASDGDLNRLSADEIENDIGITIPDGEGGRIQNAVVARLKEQAPAVLAKLSAGSGRCSEFDACSLHGDLSGASGEKLAMYEREKKSDGATFENRRLASFEALNLAAETVSTADLSGRPAVIAFLAGHCTHSMDSIPILQETVKNFGDTDLQVIGVWVNSGDPADVGGWIEHHEPEFQVWIYNDTGLGDRIDSHLVPTWLFVDDAGRILEKLVGYKDPETVDNWIRSLLDS